MPIGPPPCLTGRGRASPCRRFCRAGPVLVPWALIAAQARPGAWHGPGTSPPAPGPDRDSAVLSWAVPVPAQRAQPSWPPIVRRSEAGARAEAVAWGRARAGVGHVGDRSRKGVFLAAPASRARASSRGSLTGPVPERPRDRHGRAAVPRTTRQSGGSLAALVPAAAGGQVGGGGLWSARRVRLARAATWYGTLVFQLMMMRR